MGYSSINLSFRRNRFVTPFARPQDTICDVLAPERWAKWNRPVCFSGFFPLATLWARGSSLVCGGCDSCGGISSEECCVGTQIALGGWCVAPTNFRFCAILASRVTPQNTGIGGLNHVVNKWVCCQLSNSGSMDELGNDFTFCNSQRQS